VRIVYCSKGVKPYDKIRIGEKKMFQNVETEIKNRIPGYEGILDVVIENPTSGVFPFYDRKTPVIRLLGDRPTLVYIVMANRREEKCGWRQTGSSTKYDYYKVVVQHHEIASISKFEE